MHIRDNLQARVALGCPVFQSELKRGVHAIASSPDGHCIAVLTKDYKVLIYDKVKEKTFEIQKIQESFFSSANVSLESLLSNRSRRKGDDSTEQFKIYISN